MLRQGPQNFVEFNQAGIEDFGRSDRINADVDLIRDSCALLDQLSTQFTSIFLGDRAVFAALLVALKLPTAWQKRLLRVFGDDVQMSAALQRLQEGHDDVSHKNDTEKKYVGTCESHAILTKKLQHTMIEHGLPNMGGRTAEDIASRTLEKKELAATHLSPEKLETLRQFLTIETPLSKCIDSLNALEKEFNINLGASKCEFAKRCDLLLQAGGVPDNIIRYKASFGRRFDYYTGMFFEIRNAQGAILAGGGRYDDLMVMLGATQPVAAVGFSIWIDRVSALCLK